MTQLNAAVAAEDFRAAATLKKQLDAARGGDAGGDESGGGDWAGRRRPSRSKASRASRRRRGAGRPAPRRRRDGVRGPSGGGRIAVDA